jgi:hypothetical protein
MASLNSVSSDFISAVKFAPQAEVPKEADALKISDVASTLAVIYEAARNSVEFRSEHLIRQAAIARILKRRLFLGQSGGNLALLLIKELLWARYLKENFISRGKVDEIEKIINKYKVAIESAKEGDYTEWLWGIAACEIEENLAFNPYPQILINFVTQTLQGRIELTGEEDPKTKDIQIYIAVERAFAKNSEVFIGYHLLRAMLPEWLKASSADFSKLHSQLFAKYKEIIRQLKYPLAFEVKREVGRLTPPFNLIRELVNRYPQEFLHSVTNEKEFEALSREALYGLYGEVQAKLLRASTRSIIYIFLTKMVFGLALELPFDLFIGKTNYSALVINTLFPPALMFLFNFGIQIPDEKNTQRILDKVWEYLYEEKASGVIEIGEKPKAVGGLQKIFLVLYAVLFIGVFGLIIWFLNALDFSIVSQLIFLFFLCVVSFFAFKVRNISKEYVYEEGKEGILTSLVDFLFLPFIKVGQWISMQITYLNVLTFIFDFIIEAPLKAFLEVTEEWIHFVRLKKEEIFTQG